MACALVRAVGARRSLPFGSRHLTAAALTWQGATKTSVGHAYAVKRASFIGAASRDFHSSAPRENQRNPYEVLGLSKNATKAEIKKKYRELAKKWHPDANKSPEAEGKFSEINSAYEILKDDEKRRNFDTFGHAGAGMGGGGGGGPGGGYGGGYGGGGFGGFNQQGGNPFEGAGNFDPNDIFSSFFGGAQGGGQRARGGAAAGANLTVRMRLSFMEAAKGCKKDVSFTTLVPCAVCSGSGSKPGTSPTTCPVCQGSGQEVRRMGFMGIPSVCSGCGGAGNVNKDPCGGCGGTGTKSERKTVSVTVPAGVDTGLNMRLPGQGEAGKRGGPTGALIVEVQVDEHEFFERDGADVHIAAPVSVAQACLGGKVIVPTIDGDVELTVPAGVQPDEKRVLKNRGLPVVNSAARGNQYVHFKVVIPKDLSERQKELIKEFGSLEDAASGCKAGASGFFQKFVGKVSKVFGGK